jgi:fibronectin type 3 domain-containing protein
VVFDAHGRHMANCFREVLDIRGNFPIARISVLALLSLCVVSTVGCVGAPNQTAPSVQKVHSVTLNWSPSTSDVVGYYVYRSTSPDGPWIRRGTTAETGLSYTDSSLQGGQVYNYAVSSVDSDNVESALSDAVSAVIPSP